MRGLRGEIGKLVDTGKASPETYAEVVERALHQESWSGLERKVSWKFEERMFTFGNSGQTQANRNGSKGRFSLGPTVIKRILESKEA